jgi:hypothetical protein
LKPAIERNLKSFGGNLEKYLSDIYCDNRDNNLFSLLIVYLQDLFSFASNHIDLDDNNYKSLATFLHNMRGKRPYYFLTFNYDTILEQSIENLHLYRPPREFKSALDYEAQFPVIRKIHGGINIRYELDVEVGDRLDEYEVFARMMSDSSETHSVRSPGAGIPGTVYQMKDQSTEKDFWRYNFPLMLIPVHEAVSPENGYFKKKLEQAKECISNSGLVVAIGYNFGDEQFLNAIKESITPGAELILVGTQSLANNPINHPAYQNISTVWPQERILIFTGDGFQAFTDAL